MNSNHSTRSSWAVLSIAIMIVALLGGCELLDPNPGPSPIAPTSSSAVDTTVPHDSVAASYDRGKEIYVQYCAPCHGDSAEGTLIWPTPIQGRTGIADLVHGGRRTMPSFPTLSDSAIASIELFLSTFHVTYEGKSDRDLFVTYCSSCHGDSATGTSTFAGSIQGYEPIHDIVKNGKGEMLPVEVPDSIITRIQNYLKSFSVDLSKLSGIEYFARECAKCHGAEGEGTTRGYEIRNPVAGYAKYVVRSGRPGVPYFLEAMPSYSTSALSDAQLNEMITMLSAAQKPTDGGGLYNRFCSNCHGKDALGGPVGKNIKREVGDFAEKVREGEGGNNYSRRSSYMPRWSSSELTNAEINAMAAYVRQLK